MGLTLFGADGGLQKQEEGRRTFKVLPRLLKLDNHVEPCMGRGWVKEDSESAPTCEVNVALTPEFSAYPQFDLEMPATANWVTIEGEADCGAQGCLIHPEVFSLFGIDAFTAPPTNFSGIVDDGGKLDVVGAAFLRVEHPHHPFLYKSGRQLFYIVENMHKGVTLSLTCCQDLGIVPRKLKIARKVEDSSMEEKLAVAEDKLAIAEDKLAIAEDKLAIAEDKLAIAEDKLAIAEDKLAIAEERCLVADELSYWEIERRLDLVEEGEEKRDAT